MKSHKLTPWPWHRKEHRMQRALINRMSRVWITLDTPDGPLFKGSLWTILNMVEFGGGWDDVFSKVTPGDSSIRFSVTQVNNPS